MTPEEQREAERLAALSEGICILCRPPARLTPSRMCRAGIIWNIKTGQPAADIRRVGTRDVIFRRTPTEPPYEIITSDGANYEMPPIDDKTVIEYIKNTYAPDINIEAMSKYQKFAMLYGAPKIPHGAYGIPQILPPPEIRINLDTN